MAESKNRKTTSAKKNAAPARGSKGRATATVASPKPTSPKGEGREKGKERSRKERKKSSFSEHFLPYIFGSLALLLTVCLLLNAVGGAETPEEHLMGSVGFYLCQGLFGCFGWAVYLLPLVFVNLTLFWRRYCEERLVAVKLILSVLLMVMISAIIHVGVCTSQPEQAKVFDIGHLYRTGAALESGGIVGGVIGNLFYTGLKLPGTVVLAVVSLPLLLMLLVGVTPAYVLSKLRGWVLALRGLLAQRREAGRKAAEEKRARKEAQEKAQEEARAEARAGAREEAQAEASETPSPSGRKRSRRTLRVDADTGEVLEEGERIPPSGEDDREPVERLPFREPFVEEREHYDDSELELSSLEEEPVLKLPSDTPFEGDFRGHARFSDDRGGLVEDEDGIFYGEETETMATDMEEEAEPEQPCPEEEGSPEEETSTGYYAEVYSAGEKPEGGVMVTINKQERAAVTETGLSEEELVLSTAGEQGGHSSRKQQEYVFPSVDMLTKGSTQYGAKDAEIAENTRLLHDVLESFHIRVREISCSCGPTITRFEVKPDTGIRVRSIANLVDDIAMNLAKAGVRIEAPIPGKAAVGIEVPNAEPATVYFRNVLETPEFRNHKSRIAACLGADVSGRPVILDINKMPHLLIAGATGMGKSVCINSIVMSILYKAKPDEVKLVLIDPKKVEFAMYRELPHLLCPIVSDPKQAAGTLYCAVNEMERRFGLIEEVGVRNLAGYNEVTADDPERPRLPQIVIIIDELADLMMTAPADVETAICRLAQKARAAGIHLVIGTQRPSVDVITGLIKANIPSRIAFTVASAVDSRTIIDTVGADKLIGRGDMLYAPVGVNKPMRCQGTFVSESEVERVVTFIKENNEPVVYDEEFIKNIAVEAARCGVSKRRGEQVSIDDLDGLEGGQNYWGEDPKFWEALEVIVSKERIGTSALQRAIGLGYGRAARVMDRLVEYGFVGPDPGNKTGHEVRITHEQYMDYKANGLPSLDGGE